MRFPARPAPQRAQTGRRRPRRSRVAVREFAAESRDLSKSSLVGLAAAGLPHPFGDDADLFDAGALGGIDDVDDLSVAERPRAPDEHGLVLALLVNAPESLLELRKCHVLVVNRDLMIGGVLDLDLADIQLLRLLSRFRFGGEIDV